MTNAFDNDGNFYLTTFDESLDELTLAMARMARSADRALSIYINTDGGDATRTFALVEIIRWAKANGVLVETFVLCEAQSAGSIVAVAGTKGHRYVAYDGAYMLHYGQTSQVANSPVSAERIYKANKRHFNNLVSHYEANCDIPALSSKLQNDSLYITAQQAIEWNMADGYITLP